MRADRRPSLLRPVRKAGSQHKAASLRVQTQPHRWLLKSHTNKKTQPQGWVLLDSFSAGGKETVSEFQ
jgi:hypothetical protein